MKQGVRDLIHSRKKTGSKRGRRSDGAHIALVVEGGGMRGVVGSAMAAALEERSLLDCFDTIHGSSAGACAAAYFAAGQVRTGTHVYYEDINNRTFINPWRVFRGRPIMNTHFLIDNVMRFRKPLETDKILRQPGLLHIVVTNAETASETVFNEFRDESHFFNVLKSTITMPIIAGPPIKVDGVPFVDGGMVQQIAVQSAIDSGATHILVLLTRKENELERPGTASSYKPDLLLLRCAYGNEISELYKGRNDKINKIIDYIKSGIIDGRICIDAISRPAEASEVDRLATSASLLRTADAEARRAVFEYLDGPTTRTTPV